MSGISRRGLFGVAAGTVAAVVAPTAAAATTSASGPSLSFGVGPLRLRNTMDHDDAWAGFLAGCDPTWSRLPETSGEAVFLGNGGLGAAMYRHPDRRALLVELGDTRVRDHRTGGGRLRIGYLGLATVGEITAVDLRLSLWDAELAGTVTTTAGSFALRCLVHATRDLLVAELTPDPGEAAASWSFTAFPGPAGNPAPSTVVDAGGGRCVQDLAAGGGHATVWRVDRTATGTRIVASVAASYPARTAYATAERTLRAAAVRDAGDLAAEHRAWWHRLYPRSFVSVPDHRTQSFYWLQVYTLACATRADRPVVSTTAQWQQATSRPRVGWDLDVQLSYGLVGAGGYDELDSLTATLGRHRAALTSNVPAAYRADSAGIGRASQDDLRTGQVVAPGSPTGTPEVGDLTWALATAWRAYRHRMDTGTLRDVLYPLLRRAVCFYLHFLVEGEDGRLHLPPTYSPAYATTPDCNYDLALLTWGCRALLDAAGRLGVRDEHEPRWRDVLDRLVAPPRGDDGLWIGATRRLTSSHPHFSHLLWFHPLHLVDPTEPAGRDLLRRSLAAWLGRPGALRGHSYAAAASMCALLGDGDAAYGHLTEVFDRFLTPTTTDAGRDPTLAAPLAAAQALTDMLVQSGGGVLRIFPAVPTGWADVTVHDLRAEGGFRISAVRAGGRTRFVRIRSTAGEPCRVAPGLAAPYRVRPVAGDPVPFRDRDGILDIDLPRGADVLVTTGGDDEDLTIAPVTTDPTPGWGLPA
ncbi:MAG TPA: Tat pathway signal sequence domain protein [Actinocatenispora sp.]